MIPALDIAKYIVTKCSNDKKYINIFQLMQILYFLQTTYITIYDELLFEDEFIAKPVAPEIRSVQRCFCCNAAMPIFSQYEDIIIKDAKIKRFVDSYTEQLREIDQIKLRELALPKGSSYDLIYDNKKGYGKTIPNSFLLKLKR